MGAQFRSASYRVKMSDCFRVLSTVPVSQGPVPRPGADLMDEEDLPPTPCPPPVPPEIPPDISSPVVQDYPQNVTVCPPQTGDPAPPCEEQVSNCVTKPPSPAPVGPTPLVADGLRRSSRTRRAPHYLEDFDVGS